MTTLRLVLDRKSKKLLRKVGGATLKIRLTVTPPAGVPTARTIDITLKR